MKVLVTGAAGFIGQHVYRELVRRADIFVVGLDTCERPESWYGEWVTADITKPLAPIHGLHAVIHLAAMAAPRECDANPSKAFDVNVNGTLQVLKLALASGAHKFLFSSSAHVYGISPKYMPTDETHPLALGNTYTTTKILGEQLCELYHENHGLNYTTLRLYNTYGPGQGLGYFIPDMGAKKEIRLKDGNTTKDWVYVEDVAKAFVLALETKYVGPINIGTGMETQLDVIARLIANKTGATFESQSSNDATRMQANVARAGRVLGWHAETQLWEGLRACYPEVKESAIPA